MHLHGHEPEGGLEAADGVEAVHEGLQPEALLLGKEVLRPHSAHIRVVRIHGMPIELVSIGSILPVKQAWPRVEGLLPSDVAVQ